MPTETAGDEIKTPYVRVCIPIHDYIRTAANARSLRRKKWRQQSASVVSFRTCLTFWRGNYSKLMWNDACRSQKVESLPFRTQTFPSQNHNNLSPKRRSRAKTVKRVQRGGAAAVRRIFHELKQHASHPRQRAYWRKE